MTGEVPIEVPANYTLDEDTLRYQGDFSTYAYHESAVSFGTWSFDVDCVDTPRHHFYIAFMCDGIIDPEDIFGSIPAEYGLAIVTDVFGSFDSEFVLYRRAAGDTNIAQVIDTYSPSDMSGWFHIDITRNSTGDCHVFINGTDRMQGLANIAVTSDYFGFYGPAGPAIDNVVVSNSIDVTPPTPTDSLTDSDTDTGTIPDMTGIILVGSGIAIVVVIIAVVFLKKRG